MIGISVVLCGCGPNSQVVGTVPSSEERSTESAPRESTETGAQTVQEPEVPSLLLEEAVEIRFDAEKFPSAGTLEPDGIIGPLETEEEDGLHLCLQASLMINGSTYWFKEYYEDGAQYSVKYGLYRSTPDFAETEPLYMTENTFWLNEFCGNGDYLYWVEFRHEGEGNGTMYVMQYDLKTAELKAIADREWGKCEDPCLSASGDYLTWYDRSSEENVDIVVFKIPEQSFLDINVLEGAVCKFAPYARLEVTGGGITYFTQDDAENIYVNRLQLDSGDVRKLCIGRTDRLKEITGCYSTDRYMGYRTGYSTGNYYFYDLDTGKASYFSSGYSDENELAVFSMCCDGGYLYLNDRKNDRIIQCDLKEGKGQCWALPEGIGMHFKSCDGKWIHFKVNGQGQSMIIRLN